MIAPHSLPNTYYQHVYVLQDVVLFVFRSFGVEMSSFGDLLAPLSNCQALDLLGAWDIFRESLKTFLLEHKAQVDALGCREKPVMNLWMLTFPKSSPCGTNYGTTLEQLVWYFGLLYIISQSILCHQALKDLGISACLNWIDLEAFTPIKRSFDTYNFVYARSSEVSKAMSTWRIWWLIIWSDRFATDESGMEVFDVTFAICALAETHEYESEASEQKLKCHPISILETHMDMKNHQFIDDFLSKMVILYVWLPDDQRLHLRNWWIVNGRRWLCSRSFWSLFDAVCFWYRGTIGKVERWTPHRPVPFRGFVRCSLMAFNHVVILNSYLFKYWLAVVAKDSNLHTGSTKVILLLTSQTWWTKSSPNISFFTNSTVAFYHLCPRLVHQGRSSSTALWQRTARPYRHRRAGGRWWRIDTFGKQIRPKPAGCGQKSPGWSTVYCCSVERLIGGGRIFQFWMLEAQAHFSGIVTRFFGAGWRGQRQHDLKHQTIFQCWFWCFALKGNSTMGSGAYSWWFWQIHSSNPGALGVAQSHVSNFLLGADRIGGEIAWNNQFFGINMDLILMDFINYDQAG